jgi:hypothetical protein
MEKRISHPWDQSFELLSTRPLGMATATPEHKRAIEQAHAGVLPSLYLYGRIVNNTEFTFKLTEKTLRGDSESWDAAKPVPVTLPPRSVTNPYFGVGAWGQAIMTLTYKVSKDGGEPAPDAFGVVMMFGMSMVHVPWITIESVGSHPDPRGFDLKCDEHGAWHYDGTSRIGLKE